MVGELRRIECRERARGPQPVDQLLQVLVVDALAVARGVGGVVDADGEQGRGEQEAAEGEPLSTERPRRPSPDRQALQSAARLIQAASFPLIFAGNGVIRGGAYPHIAAQAAGDKFGAKPVCSGPFRFVERVAQDRIVLERYPNYWNKGEIHVDKNGKGDGKIVPAAKITAKYTSAAPV